MLGTIVDKVQSLFSKGFLLGAFFPVLIFVAINAVIAFFGLAPSFDFIRTLDRLWTGLTAWQAVLTGTLLIAVGVLAYLFSTLTDVVRRLLEGRYLANWPRVWEGVMAPVRNEVAARQLAQSAALREWSRRRRIGNASVSRLEAAVVVGNSAGAAGDAARVTAADTAVTAVQGLDLADANYEPSLTAAVTALEVALRTNRLQNPSDAQRAAAETLDGLYRALTNTEIKRWTEEARRKFNSASSDLSENYVLDDLYPTRLGNIRAVTESYSDRTYGVDFQYLWPRLQPVILKNDKMGPLVELAKARVDFALLTLSLAIVTTVV